MIIIRKSLLSVRNWPDCCLSSFYCQPLVQINQHPLDALTPTAAPPHGGGSRRLTRNLEILR